MAVTFVRLPAPAVNTAASATPFLTVGASGAALNDIVVVAAISNSGTVATGVADNHASTTNTWTFYKSAVVASGITVELFACKLSTALASTDHITVTYAASHKTTLFALEFTGETNALTVDVSASATSGSGIDVPPLAPVTTLTAATFVVEITAIDVATTLDVPVPTGYTAGTSQTAAIPAAYINYDILASTATVTNGTAQWSVPSTTGLGTVQVAFKSTGAAGGTTKFATLAVTTTTTPAFVRRTGKALTVTTTTTAAILRQIKKLLAVTSTTTPALLKQVAKILAVTTTTTASLLTSKVKTQLLAVTTTTTAALVKQVAKVLAVTTTTAAAITRAMTRVQLLSVTTTTTAAIVRRISKAVTVSTTTVAALLTSKVRVQVLSVTTTTTAAIVRQTTKLISVSTTTTAAIVRQIGKLVKVTTTTTPALIKQVSKVLAVTSTTVAALLTSKVKTQLLAVTTTTTAVLLKQVGKALSVTTTTTAAMTRLIGKLLSVTTTTTASLVALKILGGVTKFVTLAVTSTTTSALIRQTAKVLAVSTTTVPALLRTISKSLAVTTATTVSLASGRLKTVVLAVTMTALANLNPHLVTSSGGDLLHQDYTRNYYSAMRLRKAHKDDAFYAIAAAFAGGEVTDEEFLAAITALYGDT